MILALESSCDETALAVFDPARGMVGEWVHSQIALHGNYGGVVPDLATREHLRRIGPLLTQAASETNFGALTAVAVTVGPGLAGCLAIGLAAAKALAVERDLPVLPVNHLRGHAFSPFMALHEAAPADFAGAMEGLLPHLGLIVSGGNTLLLAMERDRRIRVLASTRDDAAGEALDKGGKLLGLGYPGGPQIERLARDGDAKAHAFPRGRPKGDDLAFSFSGLKTSLRYRLEKMSLDEVKAGLPDLCASYQEAVLAALIEKTGRALAGGEYRSLGLSGGVANNRRLRDELAALAGRAGVSFLPAQARHTGDNAGMIAFAAWADPTVQPANRCNLGIAPGLPLA